MTKPTTTTQKPTGKGKLRSKSGAKYNGVALPEDATQRRRMRNKLSAQVHRKRKQDALKTAKEEVDGFDVVICNLKMQLDDVSFYRHNGIIIASVDDRSVYCSLSQSRPSRSISSSPDENKSKIATVHNGLHTT